LGIFKVRFQQDDKGRQLWPTALHAETAFYPVGFRCLSDLLRLSEVLCNTDNLGLISMANRFGVLVCAMELVPWPYQSRSKRFEAGREQAMNVHIWINERI
jgi:hypothetical protein